MKVLIIGATSFLGCCLYDALKSDKAFEVIGTKFSKNKDGLLKFDILNDSIKNIVPNDNEADKIAVICSALSSISMVESNLDIAYDFNVTKTKRLINELLELKYKIIFISSSSVYSGKTDFDTEETPMSPSVFYGKTKAEVEEYVNNVCNDHIILRPAKIIHYKDHPKNLLTEWHTTALRGGVFNCIENCSLSVIDVLDIANVLSVIIKNGISGTFNVSTGERLYRKELVERFLGAMGLNSEIITKPLEAFNFVDGYPMSNSIANDKIVKETGYQFLCYEDILNRYKEYIGR